MIDLQDVGSRYYTYAATAIWAAEAALAAGCEVWVLDRPNPLGGEVVEGDLLRPGYESFVGAFRMPVRHGLTLGELVLLEARPPRLGRRAGGLGDGRLAPQHDLGGDRACPGSRRRPNMPTTATALVYPGGCLVEATELSEGRGTTRPFQLTGAPHVDPVALADGLNARGLPGIAFVPTYFRPQFQKHAKQVCGGVELVVTDPTPSRSYRAGVELLDEVYRLDPEALRVARGALRVRLDRPAIDLLTGGPECREAIESGKGLEDWMASWAADEREFREERRGRSCSIRRKGEAIGPREGFVWTGFA